MEKMNEKNEKTIEKKRKEINIDYKDLLHKLSIGIRGLFLLFALSLILITLKDGTIWFGSNNQPVDLYRVYVDGHYIGAIEDTTLIENFYVTEQNKLQEEFFIDDVSLPENIELTRAITNSNDQISEEEALAKIQENAIFTSNGFELIVDGVSVLNSFSKSDIEIGLENLIKAFAGIEDYNNLIDGITYDESKYGVYLEDAYIENEIQVRKKVVPLNQVLMNPQQITEFLMFGQVGNHNEYVVEMGDTIPGIANKNSLSVNELLTANPTLYYNEKENEQSLLAPGDIVITDLVLDPVDSLIKVVVEKHRVAEEVIPYSTDWVPVDYLTVGYNTEVQTGKNGAVKKTYKVQEINGKIDDTIEIASSVLLEPIPRVIHTGNTYNPLIGNPQIWRWPAAGYVVTSSYGYRWGKLHAAIDIAGSYYGSPIYAANNGYIEDIYYDRWGGWQVRINHGLGFKTVYAHLSSNPAKFVAEGQIVKPGTIIGGMGATGNVTGMHLHFEIWYNGVRINPSRWALNQRGWDYTFR